MTFDEGVTLALQIGRRDPLRVAKIATTVCKKGNRGVGKNFPSQARFAKEIGVSQACLCEWLALYHVAISVNKDDPFSLTPKELRMMLKDNRLRSYEFGSDYWARRLQNKTARNEKQKEIDEFSFVYLRYAKKFRNMLINNRNKDVPAGLKKELVVVLDESLRELLRHE